MHWAARRRRFRDHFNGNVCIHPASVYDAISARIAEELGFEAGMLGGSVASFATIGAPDLITMTLTELADQVYRICRAGDLCLMVDADHGYGNALNVKRTVEELETAGVCGLSIEDTLLPTPYGGVGKPQLISLDEGVGKMKAALAGRQDPNLVIAGRTSAPSVTGMDDAIARAQAYEAAGVDAIFFVGIKTRAELEQASAALKGPMILGSVTPELADLSYLASRRVRVALQGHQPFAAAAQAVYDTLKALRDGTAPKDLKGVAPQETMKRLLRDGDHQDWMRDFLG